MVTYEFRCDEHGATEATAPLGSPPATWPCPGCGSPARRAYGRVALLAGGRYARAIDAAERTSAEPQVVTRLPESAHWQARGSRSAGPPPAYNRLPRP